MNERVFEGKAADSVRTRDELFQNRTPQQGVAPTLFPDTLKIRPGLANRLVPLVPCEDGEKRF